MNIITTPRKVTYGLIVTFALLFLAHLVTFFIRHGLGYPVALGLVPLFYFDAEMNIPTYFSGVCLGLCSFLTLIIGKASQIIQKSFLPWYIMGIIFAFLSVDEVIAIHERLIEPMRKQWAPSGYLFLAWYIPYGMAVLVLAATYIKFLLRLPKQTFYLFMLSCGLFLSGAVGMEMISGKHAEEFGFHTMTFGVLITVEESLEMIGTIVFIYALLRYLSLCVPEVSFVFNTHKSKDGQ